MPAAGIDTLLALVVEFLEQPGEIAVTDRLDQMGIEALLAGAAPVRLLASRRSPPLALGKAGDLQASRLALTLLALRLFTLALCWIRLAHTFLADFTNEVPASRHQQRNEQREPTS
jgi:hypothetical protein